MKDTKYRIIPYKCAGPITFEMTEDDVRKTAGEPLSVSTNFFGTKSFIYDEINIGFSRNSGKVKHIGFGCGINVEIANIEVFKDSNAFEKLLTMDGDPYESVGFIVLVKFGISLTGFHDEDEKSVNAFARGEHDDIKEKGRRFTLE